MIHSVIMNRSYTEAMATGIQESNQYGTQAKWLTRHLKTFSTFHGVSGASTGLSKWGIN